MEEQKRKDVRTDHFQRLLISLFYRETLSSKERKTVIWVVRVLSSAVVVVIAMVVTLVTESIISFVWSIAAFIALYIILKIVGVIRRKLRK